MYWLYGIALLLAIAGIVKIFVEQRRYEELRKRPDFDLESRLPRRGRYHAEVTHMIAGSISFALAVGLLQASSGWLLALGGFFALVGIQLLLAALGVRHEVFANRHEERPRLKPLLARWRGAEGVEAGDEASASASYGYVMAPPSAKRRSAG